MAHVSDLIVGLLSNNMISWIMVEPVAYQQQISDL